MFIVNKTNLQTKHKYVTHMRHHTHKCGYTSKQIWPNLWHCLDVRLNFNGNCSNITATTAKRRKILWNRKLARYFSSCILLICCVFSSGSRFVSFSFFVSPPSFSLLLSFSLTCFLYGIFHVTFVGNYRRFITFIYVEDCVMTLIHSDCVGWIDLKTNLTT